MPSSYTFIDICPSYIVQCLTGNQLEKRVAATRVLGPDMDLDLGLVVPLLLVLSLPVVSVATAAALWRNVKC